MCYDPSFRGHKTLVCQVGDLKPGDRYRDPDRNEFLVADGFLVVNLATGTTASTLDWVAAEGRYRKDTKLGRDQKGRLYASHSLNLATTQPTTDSDPNIILDTK